MPRQLIGEWGRRQGGQGVVNRMRWIVPGVYCFRFSFTFLLRSFSFRPFFHSSSLLVHLLVRSFNSIRIQFELSNFLCAIATFSIRQYLTLDGVIFIENFCYQMRNDRPYWIDVVVGIHTYIHLIMVINSNSRMGNHCGRTAGEGKGE